MVNGILGKESDMNRVYADQGNVHAVGPHIIHSQDRGFRELGD